MSAGFALAVVLSLVEAQAALAHLLFVRSVPAAAEVLTRSPTEVVVTFNGALDSRSSGRVVGPGGAVVSGAPRVDGADLVIPVSGATAGTYTVTYTAIDPVDAHPTEGTFEFSVAAQPTPTPSPTPSPTPTSSATPTPMPSPTPAPDTGVPTGLPILVAALGAAGVGAFAFLRARRTR